MSISAFLQKLAASSLALLLVSCTVTKPVATARGPTGPHDLGRFVLVLQETPDGRVTHDWRPLEDFDLVFYVVMSGGGILILAPALFLTSPDVPIDPILAEAIQ